MLQQCASRPTMRGTKIQGKVRELLPIPPPTRKKISIVNRYTILYIPTRKKGKSLLQLSPLLPTRKTGRSALPVLLWLPPISLRRRRQSSLTWDYVVVYNFAISSITIGCEYLLKRSVLSLPLNNVLSVKARLETSGQGGDLLLDSHVVHVWEVIVKFPEIMFWAKYC